MTLQRVVRGGRATHDCRALWLRASLLLAVAALLSAAAGADIFHIRDGGKVDGDLLEQSADEYRIRTLFGVVVVRVADIERVEPQQSVFGRYAERIKVAPRTPAEHVAIAEWCADNGLRVERKRHLEQALALDPEYEPARRALGFEKVNGEWRRAAPQPARASAADDSADPSDATDAADDEKAVRAAQGQWSRRLRAIRSTYFDPNIEKLILDGRRRLLEIRDPLAILPLTRIFSDGNQAARTALVAALAKFPDDEATLNLAVIALLERDEDIRHDAVADLARRRDPRVVAQMRAALRSDNDFVIRNAALALQKLKSESAIPDLIDRLTAQRRKSVEVPIRRYFGSIADDFGRQGGLSGLAGGRTKHKATVGVAIAGAFIDGETKREVRDVTVFRTEILDALVAITGQNFGFDDAAWRRWYQEQKK